MAKSKTEIIHDIVQLIVRNGGKGGEWYVGMCADPKTQLVSRHNFKQGTDIGAIRTANTEIQAQEVVEFFIRTRRTKGHGDSFNAGDIYVYAYRMSRHTKP